MARGTGTGERLPLLFNIRKTRGTGGKIMPFEIRITEIFFRSALQLAYIILITTKFNNVCKITKTIMNHSTPIEVKIKVLTFAIKSLIS